MARMYSGTSTYANPIVQKIRLVRRLQRRFRPITNIFMIQISRVLPDSGPPRMDSVALHERLSHIMKILRYKICSGINGLWVYVYNTVKHFLHVNVFFIYVNLV